MSEQLPKIYLARIQKYWDKILPSGYPASSSVFSAKFDSDEVTAAVNKMESELTGESSVLISVLPEGTFGNAYFGTYDVKGIAGEKTLLFPEKVSGNVLVLHYDEEAKTWSKVENTEVIDGYVWGTLDSFSPVAVFSYKKDIHKETVDFIRYKVVVCEGNSVQVKYNDNNEVVVVNSASGTEIVLDEADMMIVGGSVDGSDIDKTNISVINIPAGTNLRAIYGGSYWYSDGTESAKVNSVNVNIVGSTFKGVTGSGGAVRTGEVNITITDSKMTSHAACIETWVTPKNKDVNSSSPSYASRGWLKKGTITATNSEIYIFYTGGNSGYSFSDETESILDGCTIGYLTTGSSNGAAVNASITMSNSKVTVAQFINRGTLVAGTMKLTNNVIENLYIGGEATDSSVNGTVGYIKCDINAGGLYAIKVGSNTGVKLTAETAAAVVDSVKVSRSAGYTLDDDVITVLGDKFIIK